MRLCDLVCVVFALKVLIRPQVPPGGSARSSAADRPAPVGRPFSARTV